MVEGRANNNTKFLADQVQAIINVLKIRKSGFQIYVAMDFSEISQYAMPDYDKILYSNESDLEFYKERIALTYLFEEYPSNQKSKLYLLPPYKEELEEAINFLQTQKAFLLDMIDRGGALQKIAQDFLKNEKVASTLEKSDQAPDSLNNEERKILLNVLKQDYLELYVALTLGTRKAVPLLKSFLNREDILVIEPEGWDDINFVDLDELRQHAADNWFWKIMEKKPESRPITNFRDALALEYLIRINKAIIPQKKMMLLVSRSSFENWSGVAPLVITLDNELIEIPYTYDPQGIFVFLTFVEYQPNGDGIDYDKTLANIEEFLNILQDYGTSRKSLPERVGMLLGERLNEIKGKIASIENLRTALRTGNPDHENRMKKIWEKIDTQSCATFSEFADRVKKLVASIQNDQGLRDVISSTVNSIIKDSAEEFKEIADLIPVEMIAAKAVSKNTPRHLLDERDFTEPSIIEAVQSLRKNKGDIKEKAQYLYRLKQKVDYKKTIASIASWEAFVIIVQLKIRLRLDKWALKDCREALPVSPRQIKPLLQFLKNIALSRKVSTFQEALKGSEELAKDANPRYLLQQAYFTWMAAIKGIKGYDLKKADYLAEKVYKAAKADVERNKNCLILALANRACFAVDRASLNEAQGYLNEASDYLKKDDTYLKNDDIPIIFYYTRAKIKSAETVVSILKEKQGVEEVIHIFRELKGDIANLKKAMAKEELSPFTNRLFHDLIQDVGGLEILYSDYQNINEQIQLIKEYIDSQDHQQLAARIQSIKNLITSIEKKKKYKSIPFSDLNQNIAGLLSRKVEEMGH